MRNQGVLLPCLTAPLSRKPANHSESDQGHDKCNVCLAFQAQGNITSSLWSALFHLDHVYLFILFDGRRKTGFCVSSGNDTEMDNGQGREERPRFQTGNAKGQCISGASREIVHANVEASSTRTARLTSSGLGTSRFSCRVHSFDREVAEVSRANGHPSLCCPKQYHQRTCA